MKGVLLDRIEDMNERIPLPPTQPSPHRNRGEHEPPFPKETVKRERVVSDAAPVALPDVRSEHSFDPDFVDFGPEEVSVDESMTGPYVEMEKGERLTDQFGGRYEVQKRLGEGGMGSVYKVKDLRNGMVKAMKFIRPDLRDEQMIVDRFEREIRVMATLQDPFILPALDVVEVEKDGVEVTGLVMAYVDGPSLEKEIENGQTLSPERVLVLTGQIAFALETLHEAGIVHRDIKPANILIQKISTGEEFVRLGDFGVVGFAFEPNVSSSDSSVRDVPPPSSITGANQIVGTPGFLSPDAAMGKKIDHRNDLYALGTTMYQMLTGKYPHVGNTWKDIVRNQLYQAPPSFESLGLTHVPEWLEHIVLNLLEPNPEDRFQTAEELFQALKEGIAEDYPELLTTIPFVWDHNRESSYDTSIRRAA